MREDAVDVWRHDLARRGDVGLTFVGLILTGFGLTLRRMASAGLPLCFGVMGVGTALVMVGLYVSGWPR